MKDKTLTGNQNPPDYNEFEHLKWQMTKLQRELTTNRTVSSIDMDANKVIAIVTNLGLNLV